MEEGGGGRGRGGGWGVCCAVLVPGFGLPWRAGLMRSGPVAGAGGGGDAGGSGGGGIGGGGASGNHVGNRQRGQIGRESKFGGGRGGVLDSSEEVGGGGGGGGEVPAEGSGGFVNHQQRLQMGSSDDGEEGLASFSGKYRRERTAAADTQLGPGEAGDSESGRSHVLEYLRLRVLFDVLDQIRNTGVVKFVTQWPAQQRKKHLEKLQTEADGNPKDPAKQAAYLVELNKLNPHAVIERFERRAYATDARSVVEYLRALMVTNSIDEFLPNEKIGRLSGLPALLAELKRLAAGDDVKVVAQPGMTEQQPLHVVMVEPKTANKPMRLVQDVVFSIIVFLVFSATWIMGAGMLRKYVNGVAGVSTSSSMPASGSYAPKEYNKDLLPEKSVKTFKDVKGCDEAKEELEEIVEYLKNPAKFTRLGGKLPKGVLLVGPPGTGKTLLARAIAGEAGVPFFYRAGSEFEEMFVGVGSRRVRTLFSAAKKKAPCIVFIDEIDAVGGNRKHWESHTRKTLNQLLVEMDGFEANEGVIVIAATNIPETLDPALTRPGRFDRKVYVPNPDVKGRLEILQLYLQDKPVSADVDPKVLARATPGYSGADLANVVNVAAIQAAKENTEIITPRHLEFAKDRISMGAERKSLQMTEECRRLTAYHESGHALVAFNTKGAQPPAKATIVPRGNALGMTVMTPMPDERSQSKLQLMAQLDVCMGGRAAEEMVFGADGVTTGAINDLKAATQLAHSMVSECGMSDLVGPVYLSDTDSYRTSFESQRTIDAEVRRLLKEAYDRVRKVLAKHEKKLHALAQALLEHETLNAREIEGILGPPINALQLRKVEDMVTAVMPEPIAAGSGTALPHLEVEEG